MLIDKKQTRCFESTSDVLSVRWYKLCCWLQFYGIAFPFFEDPFDFTARDIVAMKAFQIEIFL